MRTANPIIYKSLVNFEGFLLDVREPMETEARAVNIPLGQLRLRLGKLPRDRDIHLICRSGGRAYFATRILLQNGFKASRLTGGCREPTRRISGAAN